MSKYITRQVRQRRPKNLSLEDTVEYFRQHRCHVTKDGCWELTCSTDSAGYPNTNYKGKGTKLHRLFYMVYVGEIPQGMFVLHRCDNRKCANPAHLFLGTNADNMLDMASKGRAHKPTGIKNAAAKITESDVLTIRQRAAQGEPLVTIAKDYAVTDAHISAITTGKAWEHVGGPLTFTGKGGRTGAAHGADCHLAKITESDVREIRRLAKERQYTQAEIADMFGLSLSNVRHIIKRHTWKHIE